MKSKMLTSLIFIFVLAVTTVFVTNQPSTAAPQETSYIYLPTLFKTAVDLTVTGIEVTQGVQKVDNSVPLVTDRPTIVRIFASTDSSSPNNVTVSLSATRAGSPLGTVTSGPGTVTKDPQRSSYSSTFNVTLPADWLSGNVQLVATVDSTGVISESNEGNNSHTETVTFNNVPDLKIHILPIEYTKTGANAGVYPAPSVDYISDWIMRTYPVDNVQIVIESPYPYTGDLDTSDAWEDLIDKVTIWKQQRFGTVYVPEVVYGFIPISNGSQQWFSSGIAGIGWVGGGIRTSLGLNLGNNDTTGGLAGHEVGHNLDREHAPCGVSGDPNYPYAGASIGEYGLDGIEAGSPSLKSPSSYVDFMSYCDPVWVSDYTYTGLYNDQISNGAYVLTAVSPTDILLIRGRVDEFGGVTLDPVYAFEQIPSQAATNETDYQIELLDEAGNVIAQHPVSVAYAEEEGISVRSIFAAVSLPETAVSSVRVVSANSPNMATASLVSVQEINLADSVTLVQSAQTITLNWGNPNTAVMVRYTPDDGASWIMVGVDLIGGELVVDTSRLPGGENGRFEIIPANSSQPAVQTVLFKTPLPDLSPQSWITGPTAVKFNQPAFLFGHGSDPEDGALTEMAWFIDGQPIAATNTLPLQSLSVGEHQIMLIVQDSAGNEATAVYPITVED